MRSRGESAWSADWTLRPIFMAQYLPFWIRMCPLLAIKKIAVVALLKRDRPQNGRLIFRMAAAAAQMVEANVRNDPIDRGIKGAFEAEAAQIAVDFQESLLVDVAGIFGATQHV